MASGLKFSKARTENCAPFPDFEFNAFQMAEYHTDTTLTLQLTSSLRSLKSHSSYQIKHWSLTENSKKTRWWGWCDTFQENRNQRVKEMAPWLRVLAAFEEDESLASISSIRDLPSVTPSPGIRCPLLVSRSTHMLVPIHTKRHTHTKA